MSLCRLTFSWYLLTIVQLCCTFDFSVPQSANDCASSNGENVECVAIEECRRRYKTRSSFLAARPKPCHILQTSAPRLCCPVKKVAQFQCGNIDRTIFEVFGFASTIPQVQPPPGRTVTLPKQNNPRRSKRNSLGHAMENSEFSQSFLSQSQLEFLPETGDNSEITRPEAVGGVDAIPGKWPWMALFGHWRDAELSDWFCGGTLISADYVLTAAHCIGSARAPTAGVRLGDHDLSTNTEVQHQQANISRVIVHDQYVGSQNDIALVKLHQPVKLTDAVRPICLPDKSTVHRTGEPVSMAGWGHLQFKGTVVPDVLQEVSLQLADSQQCEETYQQLPSFNTKFPGGFQNSKLCAMSVDDELRGACSGDSGGPLMWQSNKDGMFELIGVVSTGVGCGHPDFPGVYTKVSAYIDWIERNVV